MSEWDSSTGSSRKRKAPSDGAHGRASRDDTRNEANGTGEHDEEEWSEETHRSFVAAVFHLGLKHSSPSVIRENMSQTPTALTSERIKSHLQKFRKNKAKAKEDFMEEYDSFLKRALAAAGDVGPSADNTGAGNNVGRISIASPNMLRKMGMSGKASGGAGIAAYLTYLDMLVGDSPANGSAGSTETGGPANAELLHLGAQNAQNMFTKHAGPYLRLPFPNLSDAERKSPLGVSLMYSIGCISSLTQHLLQERASRGTTASPPNGAAANPVDRANETQQTGDSTHAQKQDVPQAGWGVSVQQGTLYVQESNSSDAAGVVDPRASIYNPNKTGSQTLTPVSESPRQQISQGDAGVLVIESTPVDPDFPLVHRQYGASRMGETPASMNNNINNRRRGHLEGNVMNAPQKESPAHASPERSLVVQELQMDPMLLREQEEPPQQLLSPNNETGAELAFSRETAERRPSNYGFFQPIPESGKGSLVLEETFQTPLTEDENDDGDSDCSPTEEWFSEV